MSQRLGTLKAALADRYAIESEIGHGGMATVYLAEDLKHHRKVAVKVLRPDLAASLGADRFIREIEVAAQLTHPHILPLHDSGEADGFLYYVMPFIEGESLRERVEREGELPIPEVIRIIHEVVDALAHAHEHGVVHRDIKPDNVMLSGRHAMVTDFGVAKAVSEATGRQTLTTAGIALGTPAYMAPEQAAADPHVDHRADIYAVGAMAYELLTSRAPFIGTTPQQVLSAHLLEHPRSVASRRANIPVALDQLIMKCLAKRPADRWQNAEEMLSILEGLASTPSGGLTPTGTMPVQGVARKSNKRVAVAAGVVVAIAILGFLGWSSFRSAPPTITVSNIRQVTLAPEFEYLPVISPSGLEVAYVTGSFGPGRFAIAVQDLGGGRAIALTADRVGAQVLPRWTSDGQRILFAEAVTGSSRNVYAIPRFGGPPTPVPGATIGDVRGDSIAYIRRDSIWIQALDDGVARFVSAVPIGSHSVAWSPDGSKIAAVEGNAGWNDLNIAPSVIWILDVATGEFAYLTESPSLNMSPQWLPDGRGLLFVSDRNGPRDVYVAWLDRFGKPRGDPIAISTGLNPHSISSAKDGSKLVYSRLSFRTNVWSLSLRGTSTIPLSEARPVTVGDQRVENHGLSPDGRWLAYDANRDGNQEIYVVPVEGGETRRLTTDPSDDFHPDFSPDGREIAFYSMRHGTRDLFLMSADGANEVRLTDTPGQERHPSFSPDGLAITYLTGEGDGTEQDGEPGGHIMVITRKVIGGEWSDPRIVLSGTFDDHPRWSPDGRWIVSARGDSIVATTLDGTMRVVIDGPADGFERFGWPEWSQGGRTVYFTGTNREGTRGIWAVPFEGGLPHLLVSFDDPTLVADLSGMSINGDTVYVSITEHESDIYVMDLEY